MSRGRWVGRSLLLLFGVAIGAVATEAALQAVPMLVPLTIRVTLGNKDFHTTHPEPRMGHVFRADLDTLYSPTAEMSYRLKTVRAPDAGAGPAIGLRDDGWSGAPWAVALGDSFTAGMGVELEETWPERLERSLGRDVVNLGVDGYSSQQSTAMLREVGLPLAPKVALYLVNFNDPGDCVKYVDLARLRNREALRVATALQSAKRPRPPCDGADLVTTFAGWVGPLPPRAPPARFVVHPSEGIGESGETGKSTVLAEAPEGGWERDGFTLVVRFVRTGPTSKPEKGAKPKRLARIAGATGSVELLLLGDGRVRADFGGDPPPILTSVAIGSGGGGSGGERPGALHSVAIVVGGDGAVALAVDELPTRRGLFSGREPFSGALRLTSHAEGGELREVRGFDGTRSPFEALVDDGALASRGPVGAWIESHGARGIHSTIDRDGRLRVVVVSSGGPVEALATRPVARDRPTHLACVVTRAGIELFVDGEPAGEAKGAIEAASIGEIAIGRGGDGRGFVGTLGTTAVFPTRIAPAELKQATAGASALWHFRRPAIDARTVDDSERWVVEDESGSGNAALPLGLVGADPDGGALLDGHGGFDVPHLDVPDAQAIAEGTTVAGHSTWFLAELVHLFRRDGAYALTTADASDWLPFRSGAIDQVFRHTAIEGRLFRPDKNALEFDEGLGYVLASVAAADVACKAAGAKLVVITSASKEAVYFPQARASLPEEVQKLSQPDWVQRVVEKWCAQRDVACISLLEPLRASAAKETNLYFRVDPHWNVNGHRVAAEAIEAGLRERGLAK